MTRRATGRSASASRCTRRSLPAFAIALSNSPGPHPRALFAFLPSLGSLELGARTTRSRLPRAARPPRGFARLRASVRSLPRSRSRPSTGSSTARRRRCAGSSTPILSHPVAAHWLVQLLSAWRRRAAHPRPVLALQLFGFLLPVDLLLFAPCSAAARWRTAALPPCSTAVGWQRSAWRRSAWRSSRA